MSIGENRGNEPHSLEAAMRSFLAPLIVIGFLVSGHAVAGDKAKSPEDAFNAFKAAAKKEDVKAMMATLTKDSQLVLPGVMVVTAAMFKATSARLDKEKTKLIDEMLAKHGISEEILAKVSGVEKLDDPKMVLKAIISVGTAVKDKPGLVADAFQLFPKIDPKAHDPFKEMGAATIKDIAVDGAKATGQVTLIRNEKERTEPFFFRMEDGAWKLDMVRMFEERGPGKKGAKD
jgi:hypothetical protein